MTRPQFSANTFSTTKSSLKPTTTIVRTSAILCHGWEDAAIEDPTENISPRDVNEGNPDDNNASSRTNTLGWLDDDLKEWKKNLKPTTTVIRTTTSVYDITNQTDGDPAPAPKELGHLVPEHGFEEMHGFLGSAHWPAPSKITHCDSEARPGYATKLAHEYEDSPEVLLEKVKVLASLIKRSRNCLLYTGAGISTASGINDYATKHRYNRDGTRPLLRSPYEARPTLAHRALVALYQQKFVHYWVQQNHDGLPQKAGLPQEAINEIHGAWYDPSNPVVAMNGSLRTDLFEAMLMWEQRADLTLSLGTSMCGMNSDRVFRTVAKKGRAGRDGAIGGVIVSLQQTQFDHLSCLRIFARIDDVMEMLLQEMEIKIPTDILYSAQVPPECVVESDVYRIPYSVEGILLQQQQSRGNPTRGVTSTTSSLVGRAAKKVKDRLLGRHSTESTIPKTEENIDDSEGMTIGGGGGGSGSGGDASKSSSSSRAYSILDLRVGSRVKLLSGQYEGDEGEVLGRNLEGHYRIQFMHTVGLTNTPRPFETVLGLWWVTAAVNGSLPSIPIANV